MAIVRVGAVGAPLGHRPTSGPFLSFAPLPITFSRFQAFGPACAAFNRGLSLATRWEDLKGSFFIPCHTTRHAATVKFKLRQDMITSRRAVLMKDAVCRIHFPPYYCVLSSYPKPDSCPEFLSVAMQNLKQHNSEPHIVWNLRQCNNVNAFSDVFQYSKHVWTVESQKVKYQKETQRICQNSAVKMVLMDDLKINGALREETTSVDIHANCQLGLCDSPASCSTQNQDGSEQAAFSIQTLDRSVSSTNVLQKSTYDNKVCLSESRTLTPEFMADRTYVNDKQSAGNFSLLENRETLAKIYDKICIVDSISTAKEVVWLLTTKYKDLIHACDTEVAGIDVKQETPVNHGEIICFSIYSGPHADFGNGKSCIWVDVLDGDKNILREFAPFFENPTIKKVWHNYSFDSHVIRNYGIDVSGFHADTMHLARLWDSSRRTDGGYSLEALTSNQDIISSFPADTEDVFTIGKTSMKSLFGKKKLKKDGSEGKLITVAPVDKLQREERVPWICYSALDSVSTLNLFQSLKKKLKSKVWSVNGSRKGSMYDLYNKYWRPFGKLLVKMESEGMLVDRAYLAHIENVAIAEQRVAAEKFQDWASKYCPDAKYMNVGSDSQIRQLFFGGVTNIKDEYQSLPISKSFKVPNTDKVIEEGKKSPLKYRNITLQRICEMEQVDMYTASGWPSVSGDALKALAGKVSANDPFALDDTFAFESEDCAEGSVGGSVLSGSIMDKPSYGLAFDAFGGGIEGKKACHAIAALCEVCSIDSLISNFILPLQGDHIAGNSGRIHCSLNINTETGRLSARRPNLQNQPALEKDRYKIRQAFIAAPGNSLIVADYGQLELRILAHLADCKSMLDAFKAGGDFHSRTAMNMYEHIREAVLEERVLLEWHPHPGKEKPPVPLLKDAFAAERRKAKMLNFSIAYGKTPIGLSRDWKVSVAEAKETVDLWYKERLEVLKWQEERKKEARLNGCVHTLLGRERHFPSVKNISSAQRGHIERAAINTPVQGSAADVAMCAMLEIARNDRLKELKWKLLMQVHDEVILEGPTESADEARNIVVDCMSKPFDGKNILKVDLAVDSKCAQNWYAAK